MSVLISGVKNLVSNATSLLRGLPFSQVQSAKAKGSALDFFSGGAGEGREVDSDCNMPGSTAVVASTVCAALPVAATDAGDDDCGTARSRSSASSCSMRAFMTSSSFRTAAGTVGSSTVFDRGAG